MNKKIKPFFKIIEEVFETSLKDDKIQILRDNYTTALHRILASAVDERAEWLLPANRNFDIYPFTNDLKFLEMQLYTKYRMLFYFMKGFRQSASITDEHRRQQLYCKFLGEIHPEDAKIIEILRKKKLPKGLNKEIVTTALGPVDSIRKPKDQY